MARSSLLPRSVKYLRERGWIVAKVEQRLFMPQAKFPITRDCFSFGDLLSAHPAEKLIALVQVTSRGNAKVRIRKITVYSPEEKENVPALASKWLEAEGAIFVHGWVKRGRPPRWKVVIWQIDFDMDGKLFANEMRQE
jgi:hypothetical protein